ncbi:MAG: element excision factor XisI family protein [Gemmataceae bacterium]
MDQLERYRDIVRRLIEDYASNKPAYGDIRTEAVVDREHDHYEGMQVGWNGGRVRRLILLLPDFHERLEQEGCRDEKRRERRGFGGEGLGVRGARNLGKTGPPPPPPTPRPTPLPLSTGGEGLSGQTLSLDASTDLLPG